MSSICVRGNCWNDSVWPVVIAKGFIGYFMVDFSGAPLLPSQLFYLDPAHHHAASCKKYVKEKGMSGFMKLLLYLLNNALLSISQQRYVL